MRGATSNDGAGAVLPPVGHALLPALWTASVAIKFVGISSEAMELSALAFAPESNPFSEMHPPWVWRVIEPFLLQFGIQGEFQVFFAAFCVLLLLLPGVRAAVCVFVCVHVCVCVCMCVCVCVLS